MRADGRSKVKAEILPKFSGGAKVKKTNKNQDNQAKVQNRKAGTGQEPKHTNGQDTKQAGAQTTI